MVIGSEHSLNKEVINGPLLRSLSDMAYKLVGVRFGVVFPEKKGWGTVLPGKGGEPPEFCKTVQQTAEGCRHCRMSHVLMTVAACSRKEPLLQQCYAGTDVMVVPVLSETNESIAVISTCVTAPESDQLTPQRMKKLADTIGVDKKALTNAYSGIPEVSHDDLKVIDDFMRVVTHAIEELMARHLLERNLAKVQKQRGMNVGVRAVIEEGLLGASSQMLHLHEQVRKGKKRKKAAKGIPSIVEISAELVRRRPDLPWTVGEIAETARITPNHFSMVFHRHMGQTFSDYLADSRIGMARRLLCDLTLNVAEVARRSGFTDPGYFARRFGQKMRMAPRQWREMMRSARNPNATKW